MHCIGLPPPLHPREQVTSEPCDTHTHTYTYTHTHVPAPPSRKHTHTHPHTHTHTHSNRRGPHAWRVLREQQRRRHALRLPTCMPVCLTVDQVHLQQKHVCPPAKCVCPCGRPCSRAQASFVEPICVYVCVFPCPSITSQAFLLSRHRAVRCRTRLRHSRCSHKPFRVFDPGPLPRTCVGQRQDT